MKKISVLIFLCFITMPVVAATFGAYIDLVNNIKRLETSSDSNACKKEMIGLSNEMISAADQTMAETIMFMMVEAERNKKPIFCPPKGFFLSASAVEDLMISGYKKSNLPVNQKNSMPAVVFVMAELHRKYPCRFDDFKKLAETIAFPSSS